MPFGIAPPARTQYKIEPAGYTRRVPNGLGIAMSWSPPPTIFSSSSGYRYDDLWTLKNLARRRIFSPPGGHGGSGGGIAGIGFAEEFGSTGFWNSGDFFLQMNGRDFFFREDGSPRNRNVVEATYHDADYGDRFIAYGFRFPKRVKNYNEAGDSITKNVARAMVFAALVDRPETLYSAYNSNIDVTKAIFPITDDEKFVKEFYKAYTFRSAAEMISAMRMFLPTFFEKTLKDSGTLVPFAASSYALTQAQDPIMGTPREIKADFSIDGSRDNRLKIIARLRSPNFFKSDVIEELVKQLRADATELAASYAGEKEWFAFEPKVTYERRLAKGGKLTQAGRAEAGGGVLVEIPPLSLLCWRDDGSAEHRELFRQFVPQWTFAGLFVARFQKKYKDSVNVLWEALQQNNFGLASTYCDELIPPNAFWTAQLEGMGTVVTSDMPNLGYADLTGSMAAFRVKYETFEQLIDNESIPKGTAIDRQKWVRENIKSPDQFADPQYTGLHELIDEAWSGFREPLMALGIAYSDYDARIVGVTVSGYAVSAPMGRQPEGVPLLRTDDVALLSRLVPQRLRNGVADGDVHLTLEAQTWFRKHYTRPDDVAPVYIDPTNLIQTALIIKSWRDNILPLKMTTPRPVMVRKYNYSKSVNEYKPGFYGYALNDSIVEIQLKEISEGLRKIISPIPPTIEEIEAGFATIDPATIAFGSMDNAWKYIRQNFGEGIFKGEFINEALIARAKEKAKTYTIDYIAPDMIVAAARELGIPPLPADPADRPFYGREPLDRYIRARFVNADIGPFNTIPKVLKADPAFGQDIGLATPRVVDVIGTNLGYELIPVIYAGGEYLNENTQILNTYGDEVLDDLVRSIPNFSAYGKDVRDFSYAVAAHHDKDRYSLTLADFRKLVNRFRPGVETDEFYSSEDMSEFIDNELGNYKWESGPHKGEFAKYQFKDELFARVSREDRRVSSITRSEIRAFAKELGLPLKSTAGVDGPFYSNEAANAFAKEKFGEQQYYSVLQKITQKLGKPLPNLTKSEVEIVGAEFYKAPKPMNPLVKPPGKATPEMAIADFFDGSMSTLQKLGLTELYAIDGGTLRALILQDYPSKSSSTLTFQDVSDFVTHNPPHSYNVEDRRLDNINWVRDFASWLIGRTGVFVDDVALDAALNAVVHAKGSGLAKDLTIKQIRTAAKLYEEPVKKVAPTSVSKEINVGDRVTRGPDWLFGKQDGGVGKMGTVIEGVNNGWVRVEWDFDGSRNNYRWGHEGKYDLTVVEPGQQLVSQDLLDEMSAMFEQKKSSSLSPADVIAMAEDLDKPFGSVFKAKDYVKGELAAMGKPVDPNVPTVLARALKITKKKAMKNLTKADLKMALEDVFSPTSLFGIDSRPVWPSWA